MQITAEEAADELVYRSYRFNRERFPDIPAERFAMAYPNGAELEKRYQQSINDYANAMVKRDQLARYGQ